MNDTRAIQPVCAHPGTTARLGACRVRANIGTALLLFVIVAVGAWLRFAHLGVEAFWGDEYAYTYLDRSNPAAVHLYSHGFDAYVRLYAHGVHLFHGSLMDETTFRALPAVLGTSAIVLLFGAGVLAGSPAVGVIAAGIMAIHPFGVQVSRTATQYGHLLFGTTWLLVSLLAVGRAGRWWQWLALALASAFVFHLQVFFACAVIGAWSALALTTMVRMAVQRKFDARFVLLYGVCACVVVGLCWYEYWYYIRPSMAETGRLHFGAEQISLWQRMNLASVRYDFTSGRPVESWCYAILGAVGLAWLCLRAPLAAVALLATAAVTYGMLHVIKMHSGIGVPPRYISFLLPLFWLCVSSGLWLVARGLCRAGQMAGRSVGWLVSGQFKK